MANVFLNPFNFDPSLTDGDSSTSYTVPSGKYAIVTITLSAEAYTYLSTGSAVSVAPSLQATSNASSLTITLAAGDVLSKTETAASATTSTAYTTISGYSIAKASVQIGGAGSTFDVATVRAIASGSFTAASSATIILAGAADVNWFIAEYNSVT